MEATPWRSVRQGDAGARAALIEERRSFVAQVVRRMRLPATAVADQEDLLSAGVLGLIDAIDRFDASRGVPFEAYATQRIRGAVIDELRRLDSRGRAAWRRLRAVRAASDRLAATSWREPTIEELAAATQLDGDGVREVLQTEAQSPVSLDDLVASGSEPGTNADPASDVLERDLLDDVGSAVRSLPQRERDVLVKYYGESLTLRQIGERLGVSEARVCQLHARAIAQVRRLLFTTPSPAPLSAAVA